MEDQEPNPALAPTILAGDALGMSGTGHPNQAHFWGSRAGSLRRVNLK